MWRRKKRKRKIGTRKNVRGEKRKDLENTGADVKVRRQVWR